MREPLFSGHGYSPAITRVLIRAHAMLPGRTGTGDSDGGTRRSRRDSKQVGQDGQNRTVQSTEPLVLHVIPTPVARGAQREARALADRLDRAGVRRHRVLCLFDGPPEVECDYSLRHPGGDKPAAGFDLRLLPRLRALLGRLDPAVVVAHGSDPLKYLAPALVGRRRPLVYYAIGTYAGPDRKWQLALWRRLQARADVVAAEGVEVHEECIHRFRLPPGQVALVPNGRDPGQFRPAPAGDVRSPPLAVFVGALSPSKRPDRFVEIVAALRARGIALRAQVIGEGPLRESLKPEAAAADVEMLGSRPDVADLLREADLLVFPSRSSGEGMPGVLIEAGLAELAVVATAVPGVSSIVADGTTGLVVPEDDLSAAVEAAARLLRDTELRSEMGRAARERCMERFSAASVADQWLSLLEPLLPTGNGSVRQARA